MPVFHQADAEASNSLHHFVALVTSPNECSRCSCLFVCKVVYVVSLFLFDRNVLVLVFSDIVFDCVFACLFAH